MSWVGLGEYVNIMTQIQLEKFFHNPTHQPLKIDPIRKAGLNQIGFGRLAANPYNSKLLTIILVFEISNKAQFANPFFTEFDLSKLRLVYQIG